MKKIGIGLLIFFFLIAGSYAVLQSGIGKNFVRSAISKAFEKSGFEVHIDRIEGTLPHQIDLKGVAITANGAAITIEELKLRPILWRLLKKELAFTDVHAKKISFEKGAPFDFDGKIRLNAKRVILKGQIQDWDVYCRFDLQEKTAQFFARNPLLNGKGRAFFDANNQLLSSQIQISSDQLLYQLPFPARGRFLANLLIAREQNGYQGKMHWQIPDLMVEKAHIGSIKGTGEAVWQDGKVSGTLTAEALAKASFDLEILPGALFVGTMQLDIENLQSLHIPDTYGVLHANAKWDLIGAVQGLHLDVTATDFYYGPFFAQKVSLYSDLKDPFQTLSGLFDLEIEHGKYKELQLETASLETIRGEKNWTFRLFAEGTWKHPLEIHMDGTWQDRFSADIQNLTGIFYNHPFALEKPVHFEWNPDLFLLPDVEIAIAGANAVFHISRRGKTAEAHIRLNHLLLDFLSLNPLDVSVTGTLNLQADIQEKNNHLQGELKASIEQMQAASLGLEKQISASGQLTGRFNRDLLELKGSMTAADKPFLGLDFSLPIHFSIWPFDAGFLSHKNAKGEISFQGRIEELLDFFNLGPHRLEGQCEGHLRFTNTLYRPLVAGTIHLQEGFYENYYTGTQLHHITADLFAEKNKVYLRSLSGQDLVQTGALRASGEMDLLPSDLYPFRLDVSLENFHFVEIDLVSAVAEGDLHIEGNASSALAKGDIHILQCELAIPDHIPQPLPDLQITYRNPIHPVPPPQIEYHPYPLILDLHVFAPEAVKISGRGLHSEWKGDFHVGGTYTALAVQGNLELIAGKFDFSSRNFKLTEGSLSFAGIEHQMPQIHLAGTTETKGVTIVAHLHGPLNNPQLTLQSIPPLPLGSIMSYLLFGQDVSEIGGFQALQLASSLATLAGTGPDIMESTRRSLGVDRLRVITSPTEEGGETVSLQVGKYVSKGVLVTLTQGTEESSTNISVEIELKGNFFFQIESDQHQEQGKFTLKWNRNY